jgi:hypothetical protein
MPRLSMPKHINALISLTTPSSPNGQIGNHEEARGHAGEVLAHKPDFTVSSYLATYIAVRRISITTAPACQLLPP